MHELVHQEIFRSYKIESEIYYVKYFPAFVTVPEAPCPDSNCKLAHNLNEAISYQLMPFYIIIYLGLAFIIGFLEIKLFLKN